MKINSVLCDTLAKESTSPWLVLITPRAGFPAGLLQSPTPWWMRIFLQTNEGQMLTHVLYVVKLMAAQHSTLLYNAAFLMSIADGFCPAQFTFKMGFSLHLQNSLIKGSSTHKPLEQQGCTAVALQ